MLEERLYFYSIYTHMIKQNHCHMKSQIKTIRTKKKKNVGKKCDRDMSKI